MEPNECVALQLDNGWFLGCGSYSFLTWLLKQHGVQCVIRPTWADWRSLELKQRQLWQKMKFSIEYYPCELLFVHRDAENQPKDNRYDEIQRALERLPSALVVPTVCVIPVRMQEAWLLFDEQAIRAAAGNPYGRMPLDMPKLRQIEGESDPKELLYALLKRASDRKGRRLHEFNVSGAAKQVLQDDLNFAPLRVLPAFQQLEEDVQAVVQAQGWDKWE